MTKKPANNDRRRQFLINKSLQFRYGLYILTPLIITTAAVILNFYFGIWGEVLASFSKQDVLKELLAAAEARGATSVSEPRGSMGWALRDIDNLTQTQITLFKEILDKTKHSLIQKLVPLFFLIGVATIFISHRIAGPLYRFQLGLESISRGDMRTRIHLRKHDEAAFLALRFNRTIQNLDFALSRMKIILREGDSNPDRLKSRLLDELNKFKTSGDH